MQTVARWSIEEVLGLDWEEELVTYPFSFATDSGDALRVVDQDDEIVPSQVSALQRCGNILAGEVSFITNLGARERKAFELVLAEDRQNPLPAHPVECERRPESVRITTGDFGVEVPLGDVSVDEDGLPGPVLRLRGPEGEWFGSGRIVCPEGAALSARIVEEGPLRVRMEVEVTMPEGGRYVAMIEVISGEYCALVEERFSDCGDARLHFSFGDGLLAPVRGHWRPHSPSSELAEEGFSNDVRDGLTPEALDRARRGWSKMTTYPVDFGRERSLALQAFFPWERDVATWWGASCETSRDFIGFFCILPGDWERGPDNRLQIIIGPGNDLWLEAPIEQGRRRWGVMVRGRDGAVPDDPYRPSACDRTIARFGHPGLDWLKDQVLLWPGWEEVEHPRLLATPDELPAIRRRAREYAPLAERFAAHCDDAEEEYHMGSQPGDPAGAYLAGGEARFAQRSLDYLKRELRWRLEALRDFGYSFHFNVAITLSRPVREHVLDADLIYNAGALSQEDRRCLTAALAFLACAMSDPHEWPAPDTGFQKGNLNFHSDHYACLACLACFLPGHPEQVRWLEYVCREMDAEFLRSVHPGGVWIEAPNYQGYSMSYLIVTAVALKHSGFRDYFAAPALKETMDTFMRLQTPTDPRCGFRMLPTIGDTTGYYHSQSLQVVFGWMAKQTVDSDPELSARLMRAWQASGAPIIGAHDPRWKFAFALLDPTLPAAPPEELSSERLSGMGALLRKNGGLDRDESYLLFKMGPICGHFDPDEGSVLWYHRNAPLLADYGSMYCPNNNQPWFHNRISVDHRADHARGHLEEFCSFGPADFARGEVIVRTVQQVPEYPDTSNFRMWPRPYDVEPVAWTRGLLYDREGEFLVIADRLEGNLPTDWSINVFADELEIGDGAASFLGQFGYDLDVHFAAPVEVKLETHAWSHRGYPEQVGGEELIQSRSWIAGKGMPTMAERCKVLRAKAGAGENYLALLVPRASGEEPARVRTLRCPGIEEGVGFQIHRDGWVHTLVCAPRGCEVRDGDFVFRGRAGLVQVGEGMVSLTLFDGEEIGCGGLGLRGTGPVSVTFCADGISGESDGYARRIVLSGVDARQGLRLEIDGMPASVAAHLYDATIVEFDVPEGKCSFRCSAAHHPSSDGASEQVST